MRDLPTSAGLRSVSLLATHGAALMSALGLKTEADLYDAHAARLLALADALDAGTIRWPEEEPARTCGTCVHDRGAMCRELTRESGSGPVARWTAAWWSSRTRSPKPGAPSCPGHADKVKP